MTTDPSNPDQSRPGSDSVPPQQPPQPPQGAYGPPPGGYAPPPGGYPPPPAYGSAPSGPPLSESDQRLWATLAHAGSLLLGFIAPLIVWLVYKGRGQFVEDQAKESLNFQILVAIAYVASSVLSVVGIGLILFPIVWIVALVFIIMASVAANRGEAYRYPVNWRIVK